MKEFWVKKNIGCDFTIKGNDIIEAIGTNLKKIMCESDFIGVSGYHIKEMTLEYSEGILGGNGGGRLKIAYYPYSVVLAEFDFDEEKMKAKMDSEYPRQGEVWIKAKKEDIPEGKYVFTFNGKQEKVK